MSKSKSDPKQAKPAKKQNAFFKEFGEFINRGNVVDLAIGVAVGGAFTSIANSLVKDIIMPISSLLAGGLDFTSLSIDIPNAFGADSTAHIAYGNFIQNIVNFLLIAFTMFIIIKFINQLNRKADAAKAEKEAKEKEAKEKTKKNQTKSTPTKTKTSSAKTTKK